MVENDATPVEVAVSREFKQTSLQIRGLDFDLEEETAQNQETIVKEEDADVSLQISLSVEDSIDLEQEMLMRQLLNKAYEDSPRSQVSKELK